MIGVFVILDITQASGINFQQIGDYIGMVALAQIDPDAETSHYETVLNLFHDGPAVAGLTDWDRSYLTALYATELNQRQTNAQAGAISSVMLRDRRAAQVRDNAPVPTPTSETP